VHLCTPTTGKASRTCVVTAPARGWLQNRLSQLPGGRLAYRLKRPFADGTEVLILEPCELLRRLVALVPPPRSHLVRYHGVFGPASAWRSRIVPRPEEKRPGPCPANAPTPPPETTARGETSRIPWAELLLRVFREDVLSCSCGGRRVVLAFITEKKVVKEILEHLGLAATGPPIAPARPSAYLSFPLDNYASDALKSRRLLG